MRLSVTILLSLIQLSVSAQLVEIPEISKVELLNNSFAIDSSANAVVLWERGHTSIQRSEADRALMVFHHYGVRIKILNQEGYEHASHTIPLRTFNSNKEYATHIKAVSHHIAEDGSIVSTELKTKDIFSEKVSEYTTLSKFTLPNVRPGSVIDISYTIVSPDIFKFRSWNFQSNIPKLKSEYNVRIPAIFKYNVTLRGGLRLADTQSKINRECLVFNGRRFDCSDITYVMGNIPAFIEENYMLAAANYKSAVHFELEEALSPQGNIVKYTKQWSDVDRELMTDKSFGRQLKETKFFKSVLPKDVLATTDDREKASAVYNFIQQHIRWNNFYGKYSQNGVKQAFEDRSGNIADINLALTAALNAAGLEAYPVLVSTRDNIIPNSLHPVISEFNYVIASVKIGTDTVLADASDALLPFGQLPLRAINDRGRIIYSTRTSDWLPLVNPYIAKTAHVFSGEFDLSGKLIGDLSITYEGYDALQKRKQILSYPSVEEYQEKLDERWTNIDIKELELVNTENTDLTLIENTTVEILLTRDIKKGNFTLNPIFLNRTTRNPFNLIERTYPVDMGSRRSESHHIIIRFPKEISLESAPKNISLSIPDQGARYLYRSTFENNTLMVQQELSLNKAIYNTEEYFHLKELFSRAIQQLKIDYNFSYQK